MAKGAVFKRYRGAPKNGKPRSSKFRRGLRKLHLAVGALTGPIVLIVSLTGCLWVFQQEFEELFVQERTVEARSSHMIGPQEAKDSAQQVFEDRRAHGLIYGNADEPLELIFYEEEPEFYRSVFLDPYSGKVLGTENHHSGFFNVVLDGHMHLWLPEWIGGKIVSWAVLTFFLSLFSGLILWWPRNRKERSKRFRWNILHWRNRNQKRFDLHAVVGFYAFLFALIFVITGLSMSFSWFKEGVYKGIGGEKAVELQIPEATTEASERGRQVEQLPQLINEKYPNARTFEIHYPRKKEQTIYVELSHQKGIFYNNDYRFFDPQTLEERSSESIYGPYQEASLPDRIMRMNYDVHVGSILGLPGKIIAFISSLCIASLPVTGFFLWWTRRKKRKKARQKKARKIFYRAPDRISTRELAGELQDQESS